MAGVLGVPTVEYLPFAFFNLLNPLIAIIFGLTGFRVEHAKPAAPQSPEPADT
jgi:NhaC family Na+:H+ antiporter